MHVIVIFCLKQSKELLKKILLETKVIDWNQKVIEFGGIQMDFSDILLTTLKESNRIYHARISYNYFKRKEECLDIELK